MKTKLLILGCIVCLVALMILDSCATTPETRRERMALFQSVESGDYAEVKRLVEAGANVNAQDRDGYTALMQASGRGHTEIAKLLIEAGADVNAHDIYVPSRGGVDYELPPSTPLMWASLGGHTEIVKLLIEAGADVNTTDNGGHTALWFASIEGYADIVRLLKEAGAKEY